MYIGYSIDQWGIDSCPVSTGRTRDEAQASAIRRVLSLNITDGEIGVQATDLSEEDFTKLTQVLDDWFATKGIQ